MIEATKAYKTSDGMTFPTLEGAQIHALSSIAEKKIANPDVDSDSNAKAILENKHEIIAILKLKPRKTKAAKAVKAANAVKPAKKPAKGKGGASSVPNPLDDDLTKT
jgi:hypothetical protein